MTLPTFWSGDLIGAMFLNAVVQTLQIGSYAARIAGVKTGRVATSIALFNLFVTASRLANLFYAPLLGTISDTTGRIVTVNGAASGPAVGQFELQLRLIVLAGTAGTTLGALLIPVFIHMFMRGIASFERHHSVPRALLRLTDPRVIVTVARAWRFPSLAELRTFRLSHVPRRLLIGNVAVTGIYAIGVVAALYASVLEPSLARTATLLSGIINGIATISFTLIVDPASSYIVDQGARGERPIADVRSLVFYLALTAIVGTLLSQLILYPSALIIRSVAHLFHHAS